MVAGEMGIRLDTEALAASGRNTLTKGSGRYTSHREHSRGGMGRILLVNDEYPMRDIALKELLPKTSNATDGASEEELNEEAHPDLTAETVARFIREAQVTGQLAHPSIVPVYELGKREDRTLYYTMKLVCGGHRSSREHVCSSGWPASSYDCYDAGHRPCDWSVSRRNAATCWRDRFRFRGHSYRRHAGVASLSGPHRWGNAGCV